MTTRFIMQTLINVISVEFLLLSCRPSFWQNVPSGKEQGETAVFAGYNWRQNELRHFAQK